MPDTPKKTLSFFTFMVWLLIISSVSLLSYLHYHQFNSLANQVIEQLLHTQVSLAHQVASNIEQSIILTKSRLSQLTDRPEIQYHQEGAKELLDSFLALNDNPAVAAISYLDSKGKVVYNSGDPKLIGADRSSRDYFKKLKLMPPKSYFASEQTVLTGKNKSGQKGIVLAANIYQTARDSEHLKPGNEFSGVLVLPLSPSLIAESIMSFIKQEKAKSESLWIIDRNGEILYHSDYPEYIGRFIEPGSDTFETFATRQIDQLNNLLFKKASKVIQLKPNGSKIIAAYAPINIENTSWGLGVAIPYSHVADIISKSFRYGIYAFSLSSGLLLFLLFYFSHINRKRIAAENEARFASIIENQNADLNIKTEELSVANEELLSTNEELTISNQELESSYEQLRNTTDELTATYRDLNNAQEKLKENYEIVQKANRELHRINRIKSDFICMASHELKTPLTPIKGYAYLLLRDSQNKFDQQAKDMFSSIAKSADRLETTINDMLDISRIESRKLNLHYNRFPIQELLEDAKSDVLPYLQTRNQTLTIIDNNPQPVIIEADRNRLSQLFVNLFGNAIKFSPDGREITVIIEEQNQGKLLIKVIDQGIGLDPDEQTRIFDEFYEVGEVLTHSTDKIKFMGAGSGLGLAICKGIVEAHRGEIWVESPYANLDECPGSTFYILLPIKSNGETQVDLFGGESAQTPSSFEDSAAAQRPGKILIIENDDEITTLTKHILTDKYMIDTAKNGMAGLKKVFDFKPDLILLDIYFPGPNGFEVCELLKKNNQTREIPVIMFCAGPQKSEIEKCLAAGADDYVTIPFENQELIELIERLLEDV